MQLVYNSNKLHTYNVKEIKQIRFLLTTTVEKYFCTKVGITRLVIWICKVE